MRKRRQCLAYSSTSQSFTICRSSETEAVFDLLCRSICQGPKTKDLKEHASQQIAIVFSNGNGCYAGEMGRLREADAYI